MRNPYNSRRASTNNQAINLDSSLERYKKFITSIVKNQQVWGLYTDGWAIGATSQGRNVLPLWSEKTYAQFCKTDSWEDYEATSMTLESFIFKLLPFVSKQNYLLSLMMTPDGKSVFIEPDKVLSDIKSFLYDIYVQQPDFFKNNPGVPLPRKIRLSSV